MTVLARGSHQRGFTAALTEMIDELKSYRCTPEDLRETANAIDDVMLSAKLFDLALLYEGFTEKTKSRFEDADDRMVNLTKSIKSDSRYRNAEIWLDGFIFFNPQEREVVRAFIEKAKAVHITLPLDRDILPDENIPPHFLFYRAAHTLQRLKKMTEEINLPYRYSVYLTFISSVIFLNRCNVCAAR